MSDLAHAMTLTFAAGCIGGLANSVAVWGMGQAGLTAAMGVQIKPAWTPAWLYPRLVWGGLWGFLFILPWMPGSILVRGVLYSLGPTAVVLFLVFPMQAKKGMMGLQLGALTPLFALIVNAVWGIATAGWLRFVQ